MALLIYATTTDVSIGLNRGMSKALIFHLSSIQNFLSYLTLNLWFGMEKRGFYRFVLQQGHNHRPKWRHI